MLITARREEDASRTGYSTINRLLPQNNKKRAVASKYDVHKVKVWLGDKRDHYYILSRFLVSRSLTITKIPSTKAVKIALELKKHLVDHDKLSVSQVEVEETLFALMREKGYGQAYIDCYRTVSEFYQMRQPLVIILCGAPCTGKSTIAQQLAARLNMPNVMQTDVICELMRRGTGGALAVQPPWTRSAPSNQQLTRSPAAAVAATSRAARPVGPDPWDVRASEGGDAIHTAPGNGAAAEASTCCDQRPVSVVPISDSSGAAATAMAESEKLRREAFAATGGNQDGDGSSLDSWLLSEFQNECRLVRRALQGDFNKALHDGKPLIVEGAHLDPGQLLKELQDLGIVILPVEPAAMTPGSSSRSEHRSPPPPLARLGSNQASGDLAELELEQVAGDSGGGGEGNSSGARCRSSPLPHQSIASPFPSSSSADPATVVSGSGSSALTYEAGLAAALRGPNRLSPLGCGSAAVAHSLLVSGDGESDGATDDLPLTAAPAVQKHHHQQQQGRLYQKHVSWGAVAEQRSGPGAQESDCEQGCDEGEGRDEVADDEGHGDGEGEDKEERRRGWSGGREGRARRRRASGPRTAAVYRGSCPEGTTATPPTAQQSSRVSEDAVDLEAGPSTFPQPQRGFPEPVAGRAEQQGCLEEGSPVDMGADKRFCKGDVRPVVHSPLSRSEGPHRVVCEFGTGPVTITGMEARTPPSARTAPEEKPGAVGNAAPAAVAVEGVRLSIAERRRQSGEPECNPDGCPLRIRLYCVPLSHEPPRIGSLTASAASPPLGTAEAADLDEELDGQSSPQHCRWGIASSHGGSSPRASTCRLDGDGASDVNNYGDADTDGAVSRNNSPPRGPVTQASHVGTAEAEFSSDLDDAFPPIRRAKSHPVIFTTGREDHDGGGEELERAEEERDVNLALEAGVVGGSEDVDVPGHKAAGNLGMGCSAFSFLCTHQPMNEGTEIPGTATARGEGAGGGSGDASSVGGPRTTGGLGGANGGGAVTRQLDRARSHLLLLSAATGRHTSTGAVAQSGTSHHLQQSSTPGFCRNGSLSTMDLHSVRSSLAGILRMGSVAHGSRLSPSPRLSRAALPGRAGTSCGTSPSSGGAGGPSKATRIFRQGAPEHTGINPPQRTPLINTTSDTVQHQQHPRHQQEAKESLGAGAQPSVMLPQRDSTQEDAPSGGGSSSSGSGGAGGGGVHSSGAGGLTPGEAAPRVVLNGISGDAVEEGGSTAPVQRGHVKDAAAAAVFSGRGAATVAARTGGLPETYTEDPLEGLCAGSSPAVVAVLERQQQQQQQQQLVHPKEGQHEPTTSVLKKAPVEGGSGGGAALPPLFVPVVLCMSEADHRLALEDNAAMYDRGGGGGGTDSSRATATGEGQVPQGASDPEGPDPEEVLRRVQILQHYLCSFESQGMPVVSVRYGNFTDSLDVLHEYVLMCVQAAMEQVIESRVNDGDLAAAAAVAQ